MNPHPVLAVVKIAAFTLMAFLLGLVFWQGNRREEEAIRLQGEVGALRGEVSTSLARAREQAALIQKHQESVDRLAGAVEALKDVALAGGLAARAAGAPPAAPETAKPRVGPAAGAEGVPGWVTGRARELWGRYPNYLTEDADRVVYPALDAPGVDPNGRVRTWFQSALSGLNPITKQDGTLSRFVKLRCLSTLADYHDRNPDRFRPSLAVRAEVDPEFREYVVWLRPGVKWQRPQLDLDRYPHLKGEHLVTAQDCKFTMDLILDPSVQCGHLRSYYSECEGIEVVDDTCLIFRWRKKQWNSRAWTLAEFYPLPEFVFGFDEAGKRYTAEQVGPAFNDHWFYRDQHFIGCGPYVMVEYDPTSHCLERRNDEFFDPRGLPPIRELYLEIFNSRELQVKKLMAGEHDYGGLLPNDWDRLRKDPSTPLYQGKMEENWVLSTQYGFIGWKMNHPIFRDVRVRRAMTMACNRKRLADSIHLGKSVVISGPHHVASPNCPKDLEPLPFDLDAARALLAEAGWKDADGNGVLEATVDGETREFRFKAMVPQNEEWKTVFEIFKEDLSKVGVQMDLEPLQWGQFSERLEDRKFECTALYWDTSGWDDDLYQIWHSSQVDEPKSSNFIEFKDAEVDRLIEELRATFDVEKRHQLQQQAHRRIAELQPYTFLETTRAPILTYKDRVQNVKAGLEYRTRPFARLFPMYVPQR